MCGYLHEYPHAFLCSQRNDPTLSLPAAVSKLPPHFHTLLVNILPLHSLRCTPLAYGHKHTQDAGISWLLPLLPPAQYWLVVSWPRERPTKTWPPSLRTGPNQWGVWPVLEARYEPSLPPLAFWPSGMKAYMSGMEPWHLGMCGVPPAWGHHRFCRFRTYQSLLYEETEQDGVAHFSEALEHVCFEFCVLDDVLQLMVEELQDPWEP